MQAEKLVLLHLHSGKLSRFDLEDVFPAVRHLVLRVDNDANGEPESQKSQDW